MKEIVIFELSMMKQIGLSSKKKLIGQQPSYEEENEVAGSFLTLRNPLGSIIFW